MAKANVSIAEDDLIVLLNTSPSADDYASTRIGHAFVAQAQGDVIILLDTSPHDDCSSVDTDEDFPSADIHHAYTAPARAENVAPQREHERKSPSATPPRIYAAECPRHRTEISNTFIDGLRQLSDLTQHLKTFLGRPETQTGQHLDSPHSDGAWSGRVHHQQSAAAPQGLRPGEHHIGRL